MKKLKAFTLIELIIVMAIFAILMSGIMTMYRTMRVTYTDSSLYEKQRTVQNGIAEYLCETTRYADNLIIYDEGVDGISNVTAAINDFKTTTETKRKDEDIRVIIINRKQQYSKTGIMTTDAGYTGRLITNIDGKKFTGSENGARTTATGATGDTYMALGGGYYGASDFIISVDSSSSAEGLTFKVTNSLKNMNGVVKDNQNSGTTVSKDGSSVTITTTQSNITPNNKDNFAYHCNASGVSHGTITATGTVSGGDKNTYIVFTVPTENEN